MATAALQHRASAWCDQQRLASAALGAPLLPALPAPEDQHNMLMLHPCKFVKSTTNVQQELAVEIWLFDDDPWSGNSPAWPMSNMCSASDTPKPSPPPPRRLVRHLLAMPLGGAVKGGNTLISGFKMPKEQQELPRMLSDLAVGHRSRIQAGGTKPAVDQMWPRARRGPSLAGHCWWGQKRPAAPPLHHDAPSGRAPCPRVPSAYRKAEMSANIGPIVLLRAGCTALLAALCLQIRHSV